MFTLVLILTTIKKNYFELSHSHLRISSGSHELLKPFDLIPAYKLKMWVKLINQKKVKIFMYFGTM